MAYNGSYGDQYDYQRYEGDGGGEGILILYTAPVKIPTKGGISITLYGVFPINTNLNVHLGPSGIITEPRCYSGIIGQGFNCISTDGSTLIVVIPASTKGSNQFLVKSSTESNLKNISSIEYSFGTTVFNQRRNFTPWYGLGPRRLDSEPHQ